MDWYPQKPISGGRPGNSLFRSLMRRGDWTCEAKLDGVRAVWGDGLLWSRTGLRIECDPRIGGQLAALDIEWADGELCGDILYLFDVRHPGPQHQRRSIIEKLTLDGSGAVRVMPRCHSWRDVVAFSWEGCVFKRIDSPYPAGHRAGMTTPNWIKFRSEDAL